MVYNSKKKEVLFMEQYETTKTDIERKQDTLESARSLKENSPMRTLMRDQFGIFGGASLLYAVFFTLCLYRNGAGITAPFFTAGTLVYFVFCMKKLEVGLKKTAGFYFAGIILLGISMFMTDNETIIIMNYMGMLVLICVFLVVHFYEEKGWGLAKYIERVAAVLAGAAWNAPKAFPDFNRYRKNRKLKMNDKAEAVVIGLSISVPLLLLVINLLASADAVFNKLFGKLFEHLVLPSNIMGPVIMMLVMFFVSYGMIAGMAKADAGGPEKNRRIMEPVIAITVTMLLAAVYLVFSVIQILYLFIGKMTLIEGYTYASYAREGFFQLLFVCVINLAVVTACLSYFRKNKVLTGILTVISICTYIMTASSAFRMILYIRTYNLTSLRILVLWALLVIALIMAGLMAGIYKDGFPLFHYCTVVVTILYICLAFSRPDYWIAEYNLNRSQAEPDISYIAELSADAAPAVAAYMEAHSEDMAEPDRQIIMVYFDSIKKRTENTGIRNFNMSLHKAVSFVN